MMRVIFCTNGYELIEKFLLTDRRRLCKDFANGSSANIKSMGINELNKKFTISEGS